MPTVHCSHTTYIIERLTMFCYPWKFPGSSSFYYLNLHLNLNAKIHLLKNFHILAASGDIKDITYTTNVLWNFSLWCLIKNAFFIHYNSQIYWFLKWKCNLLFHCLLTGLQIFFDRVFYFDTFSSSFLSLSFFVHGNKILLFVLSIDPVPRSTTLQYGVTPNKILLNLFTFPSYCAILPKITSS